MDQPASTPAAGPESGSERLGGRRKRDIVDIHDLCGEGASGTDTLTFVECSLGARQVLISDDPFSGTLRGLTRPKCPLRFRLEHGRNGRRLADPPVWVISVLAGPSI